MLRMADEDIVARKERDHLEHRPRRATTVPDVCTSLSGLSLAALSRELSGRSHAWGWYSVVQGGRQGGRAVGGKGRLIFLYSRRRLLYCLHEAVPDFREVRLPLWPPWCPVYASYDSFGVVPPPTHTQHAVRVVGETFPGGDFHPTRNAKLRLAH